MTNLSIEVDTTQLKSLIRRVPEIDSIINDLAAEQALEEADRRAPVDTGYLQEHIIVEKRGRFWSLVSQAAYSIWVEFGTSKMAAQPFLIPALNSIKWSAVIRQALRKVGF